MGISVPPMSWKETHTRHLPWLLLTFAMLFIVGPDFVKYIIHCFSCVLQARTSTSAQSSTLVCYFNM